MGVTSGLSFRKQSRIIVLWAWIIAPAMGETLTYVLTPQPEKGCTQVELTWATHGRSGSRLCVAQRLGTVADVPALLKDMQFEGTTGVRQDKACWQVTHRSGAEVRCRYTVDPERRRFDWKTTHHPITTATFFHGMGSAFLLVPSPGGDTPEEFEVVVRWRLPTGWDAVCSWGAGRTVGARLKPEEVRESVYLAGTLVMQRTKVPGANELTVAMVDRFGFEASEFAELAAGIIAGQCSFMHEERFPPFVVTAIPVGEAVKAGDSRLAGMGLYHSFALCVAPEGTLTEGVELLFAHELFHFWNGRMLPPEDPQELVYWFVEGFTDYYSLRILYESGHWKPAVYAQWINRHLREYAANPARNATNEAIKAGFWTERDTVGEVAYQRGLLLGLRWHKLARGHGVVEGIDRLFMNLVRRGREGGFKLSNEAIRKLGGDVLGAWFPPEFDRYVVSAKTVDVPADALSPEFTGRVKSVYEYVLGFDRERSLAEQRVCGLVAGTPAAQAGLKEGDELAAWTIPGDTEQKVELKVIRGGKVKKITYFPRGAKTEVLQFTPTKL